MTASIALLIVGFVYSLCASYLAYRESGETWMLFFPTWIDVNCGISNKVRWHGKIAFAILFIGICGFII